MQVLRARYAALDPEAHASIDAFLAAVDAARTACGGPADENRAQVALIHARGLVNVLRDAEAERVLTDAIEATTGDNETRVLLHLDLAELRNLRRESDAVLALTAKAEAMCAAVPGLADAPDIRAPLLMARCQAWIDLGRTDRMADLAAKLGELAPSLEPDLRRDVALQRSNALLALQAWALLESAARDALADRDLPPALSARWGHRRGLALSEIARLDPARADAARRTLDEALQTQLLEEHEQDATHLTLADLDVRIGNSESAAAHLAEVAARRGTSGPIDVEQRATFEALAVEVAFATHAAPSELDALRARSRAALTALREDWLLRPLVPGGQGFLLFGAPSLLLGQYARLEMALEGEQVGVERALAAIALLQSAGTVARTLDLGEIDAQRLRAELLYDDATLIAILPNSLRTHVFVLGPKIAFPAEAAPLERLEVLRGELTSTLYRAPVAGQTGRAAQLDAASASLRDGLLDGRVIAELQARPVLFVVGADLMGGLPIEALDLGSGRPFGADCGIAHAPSLPLAIELAARSRAPVPDGPWDAVVFGAPEHSDSVRERWPRIRSFSLDETSLRGLGEGFDPARVRVLAGPEATLAGLQSLDLGSARLLQVVTHGVFDPLRDEPAGIVVSSGGGSRDVAWYADLRALRAPRVVALWACGTQRGPSRLGDDTASHLGGAFCDAGVCTVLVSRADLALDPVLRMARRVARGLAGREAQVESLRAARAELAADPKTADPFYCATVVLYGDPGRRDLVRSRVGHDDLASSATSGPSNAKAAIVACASIAALFLVARYFARRRSPGRARTG